LRIVEQAVMRPSFSPNDPQRVAAGCQPTVHWLLHA
jgi:hypothetical protein